MTTSSSCHLECLMFWFLVFWLHSLRDFCVCACVCMHVSGWSQKDTYSPSPFLYQTVGILQEGVSQFCEPKYRSICPREVSEGCKWNEHPEPWSLWIRIGRQYSSRPPAQIPAVLSKLGGFEMYWKIFTHQVGTFIIRWIYLLCSHLP